MEPREWSNDYLEFCERNAEQHAAHLANEPEQLAAALRASATEILRLRRIAGKMAEAGLRSAAYVRVADEVVAQMSEGWSDPMRVRIAKRTLHADGLDEIELELLV